jgi:hypothetical protein
MAIGLAARDATAVCRDQACGLAPRQIARNTSCICCCAFNGRCRWCIRSLATGELGCLSSSPARPEGTATAMKRCSPSTPTARRWARSAPIAASPTHAVSPSTGKHSGSDRLLALGRSGRVLRDSGRIEGLNPGGGNFGPDGRYHVGLRGARTIMAFSPALDAAGEHVLPPGVVPFPRGFAFGGDSRLFLASGIRPNGEGDDTILAFAPGGAMRPSQLVSDPVLTPSISRSRPTATLSYPASARSGCAMP